MGAHSYVIAINESDQKKVIARWKEQVDEDAYDSGQGSYAGNATTMHGSITFYDRKFATESEAERFILDKHEKWNGPVAASFLLPAEETEKDKARKARARERFETIEAKQFACHQSIVQAFLARTSTFIGCKGCGSKLSHEKLKGRFQLGKEHGTVSNFTVNGVPRQRTFTFPTLPVCPLCNASLLSETDQDRIKSHAEKIAAEEKDYMEALKPKTGDKIAWAVGGWAAS
jgi:hypothetical protein